MLNKRVLPAHILAGYVWQLWMLNAGVGTIRGKEGKRIARIAPLSDEPDLADSGESYVLYGWAENEQGKLPVHHTGQFALRIIANNVSEMSEFMRIIQYAFEVEDEAAEFVNSWSTAVPDFQGIRFTSICVSYVEATDATKTEGATIEGAISLKYKYVLETDEVSRP